ncbi:MAG: 23S rRNA (adenine(2503)-C(2))-methyltransferase RlmN [Pleurocapsa minor GSE-CHR-MK-17-07R]|jgi:23S rRNA (adenine2503-C2)-methyltransferase|nr:23S rRNA (adenine(2503)-C(2))-methyltransferase RlmN [Pleurocapsa minor GSE-CHR-MK 17-07R]
MTIVLPQKADIYGLTLQDLTGLLAGWGQPKFRAKQVWDWLYDSRVDSFDKMTNLPRALREQLDGAYRLGALEVDAEQHSVDGTVKRLFRLHDGQLIESVLMEYDDERRTACISTQAGCAMGCVFCATGQMGFARQLTADEIFEQALYFARDLEAKGDRLSNVVLMGMGEPFHNYDNSIAAVRRLMNDLGIGARHITISTVGLVPMIRRFADEDLQVKLAVSLHAATDAERSALLPVNRRYPLNDLIAACRYYVRKSGRRMTFEWTLINGQNDTPVQAHTLGQLLNGLNCHVNVIPLNPTGGFEGDPSVTARVEQFIAILATYNITATSRVRRGIDIDAGCGQLKSKVERARRAGGDDTATVDLEDALPE